ncbi:MAG: HNH endonuclease, partial [Nanoarchaeota archaeon]
PRSRGGKNTFENCVCSCKECNRKKGNRTPSEAKMFLIKQPSAPTINEFLMKKIQDKIGAKDMLDEIFSGFYK